MPDPTPQYIALEGVIGVGKTSLARLLATRLEASPMLEEATSNPFLTDFYKNRMRFAFQTQLYFLLSRYQQQQKLHERDLFEERIITDYMFEKDALFASVNLSDREMALYNKLATVLKKDIVTPDLVIFLQASTPILMKRIRKRNRDFEKPIDQDYLEQLNQAYNNFFFHYNDAPLLVIKTDGIDFVANSNHLDDLVEQIKKPRTRIMYYAPAGDVQGQIM